MNASKRRNILVCAALAFLIAIAFEPVRLNEFVDYDDNQYLTENPHLQSGFTRESVAWAFTSGYAANWHPLTWLSHLVDVQWFGLNPAAHHFHNVLLHALTAILLFLILEHLTGALWRSAFVAMAFGIHPLRVESVAWAAERKDVLCALFWMLTTAAYLHYVRRGGLGRYLLVVVCFALGLMTKPMLVTLPLGLLILDWWPLGRMSGARGQGSGENTPVTFHVSRFTFQQLVLEKIPLFALVAISCIVTFQVQQQGKSMTPDIPLVFRVANALNSYVAYLGSLFRPADLAVLYPYPVEWSWWKPLAALSVLVLVSVFVWRRRTTQPYLAAGWCWYLVTLVPVIGLVQVGAQSRADRYTCLPSIGIFIMLAWTAARVSAGWRFQKAGLALLGGAAAVAMIAATRTQTGYWKDSVTLFTRAVSVTRNNHVMEHSLGWALAKENKLDAAAEHLQRALRLWPDPETNLDMADVLIRRGRFDEAVLHLQRVLRVQPTNAVAYYDLGIVFQGRQQVDEAVRAYERALQLDRTHSGAWNNLGILKTGQGSLPEAAECFQQSLRSNPRKAETHRNLAAVLQMQDQLEEAVTHYRTALQLDPRDDKASGGLACALHGLGRLREAAACDRYTLRLNPDHAQALNDLAWILATTADPELRNPAEALLLAQKACALTGGNEPDFLDTLAAAQAGVGKFDDAVATVRKAIELAKGSGHEDPALAKRLELYQAGRTYQEPLTSPGPQSQ